MTTGKPLRKQQNAGGNGKNNSISSTNISKQVKRIANLTDTEINALTNDVTENDLRYSEFEDLPESIPVVKRRKLSIISQYLGSGHQLNDSISMAEIQEAVNMTTMGENNNDHSNDNQNDGSDVKAGMTPVESNSNYGTTYLCSIITLSMLGLTPALWRPLKDKKWFLATLLFFLFLLDLTNAVFDFILGVRTCKLGNDGPGAVYGIFLIAATTIGRLLSGLYGQKEVIMNPSSSPEKTFINFALLKVAVFFVEDGAAILLLANRTGALDIVQNISMYLTLITWVCYIVPMILVLFTGWMSIDDENPCETLCSTLCLLIFLGSIVFQSYILISLLILPKYVERTILKGPERVFAFLVYIINALLFGNFPYQM